MTDLLATTLARPQPVGVFPLPAGYLLISDAPEHDEPRSRLVAGQRPSSFPASLRYYEAALDGDLDAAIDALGDDLVSRVNRLVLDPSPELFDQLTAEVAAVADPHLTCHVRTVGFIVGLCPEPPESPESLASPESSASPAAAAVDGEFGAMAHAARATRALERGDRTGAIAELELAAQAANPVSPAFAGQLLGQLAHTQLDDGNVQRAAVTFQAALDALADTELYVSRAELHVAAGAMFQEMSEAAPRLLQNAINHYQQALALVTATTAPETVAIANANLGLAYLTMPMSEASDQLRVGVAVQSLREALNYFTPENNPERWSSTQLNLANALVYMPSKHQAENIAEAVGLYEGVLQHRDRHTDPQGRARVLANQGNALAHLGVFDDAKAKLHEARALFEEFDQHDAVASVRSVLDEISKHQLLERQDAP